MSMRWLCAGMMLALWSPTSAAEPSNPPAAGPCDRPECRQFDFWIGVWDVSLPDGSKAGTNRIEKILDGCVLEENWTGAQGLRGKSLNLYSAGDRRWHQTWVDSKGSRLDLAGGLRGKNMVLEGEVARASGVIVAHRITWEPLDDGGVRQHWQSSQDGRKTWSDAFIGIYRRQAE